MTAPEPTPTADHIDAVARAIHAALWSWINPHNAAHIARVLLTSTDPAVHAAMLAALVRAGVPLPAPDDIKAIERARDLAHVWEATEPHSLMSRRRAAAILSEVLDQ